VEAEYGPLIIVGQYGPLVAKYGPLIIVGQYGPLVAKYGPLIGWQIWPLNWLANMAFYVNMHTFPTLMAEVWAASGTLRAAEEGIEMRWRQKACNEISCTKASAPLRALTAHLGSV